MLVPLMVVTLLGNVVIIVVLTFSRRHNISSRVNIFIINLAIGDLTVLTCTMTTEVRAIGEDDGNEIPIITNKYDVIAL